MLTHGKYLLDTCTCIAIIKKKPNAIRRLREVGIDECKISDITLAELYFGAYKSGRSEHFEDVVEIMKLFEQYPISELKKYGEIRWQLESKGQKIGDMDMFIAATAMEEDLVVVTGNTDHFSRIEGLKVENWM
ncbi:MAG: type II toxin-antitoxin system VapC family toxin [Prevotella sp.]|nr:type II toxin-antitoxin system VapC family toxin [Prevotella sp.]